MSSAQKEFKKYYDESFVLNNSAVNIELIKEVYEYRNKKGVISSISDPVTNLLETIQKILNQYRTEYKKQKNKKVTFKEFLNKKLKDYPAIFNFICEQMKLMKIDMN